MVRLMVRYRVKARMVAKNEKLVRAVYQGLRELGDPDVHYATFKLDDGRTFVHIASFPSARKQAALTGLKAFKAFQEELQERCDEPPDAHPMTEVGSYGFGPSD